MLDIQLKLLASHRVHRSQFLFGASPVQGVPCSGCSIPRLRLAPSIAGRLREAYYHLLVLHGQNHVFHELLT